MKVMSAKYIIRLDDACPTMDKNKWNRIEDLLNKYDIKPIVAVIPNNNDPQLIIDNSDNSFWNKVRLWQMKGWEIALHGYDHLYITTKGGLVPKNNDSEFAGVTLANQEEKITKGINIFKENQINTKIWVAPSHSFDENTLIALKKHTNVEIISDGIALRPFKKYSFKWIPQQLCDFKYLPFGVWTICLHPNTLKDERFLEMEKFLRKYRTKIISASDVTSYQERESLIDKIYAFFYWMRITLIKTLYAFYLKFKRILK